MTLASELQAILDGLRQSVPQVDGAIVASTDGMTIAHALPNGEENRVAAMVATALGLGKRICESVGGGQMRETSVVGTQRHVYVYAAGPRGVLAVLAAPESNVGLIHLEARAAARRIENALLQLEQPTSRQQLS